MQSDYGKAVLIYDELRLTRLADLTLDGKQVFADTGRYYRSVEVVKGYYIGCKTDMDAKPPRDTKVALTGHDHAVRFMKTGEV